MTHAVLSVIYHLTAVLILIVLAWNTVTLKDPRKQIMSAIVMVPFLLRALNLK